MVVVASLYDSPSMATKTGSYNISIEIIKRCVSVYFVTAFGVTASRSAALVFPATSHAARCGAANLWNSSTTTITASPAVRRAVLEDRAAWGLE